MGKQWNDKNKILFRKIKGSRRGEKRERERGGLYKKNKIQQKENPEKKLEVNSPLDLKRTQPLKRSEKKWNLYRFFKKNNKTIDGEKK